MKHSEPIEYIIRPPGKLSLNLKELWQYRELFYFFTWRDIKVKYKQTVLGFLWAILQPLLMMVVFVLFFAKALNIPTDNIPAPIFYYSGLLLWIVFSSGVSGAGNSMVSNANIIKKIYFPRLIIPISSILTAVFDFLMALILFFGLLLYYSIDGYEINMFKLLLYLPLGLILTVFTAFGLGSLIAALNVKYRDFRYIIPFFIQFLLFLTPVIYPVSIFEGSWIESLLSLNPMTGAITLSRSAFISGNAVDWSMIGLSIFSATILFFIGVYYFRKTEAYFADLA